jgi:hypothetical protein
MRKSPVNPTFAVAELRSAIELAVEAARNAGVRHYVLAQLLEDAAQVIRIRRAACSPIL